MERFLVMSDKKKHIQILECGIYCVNLKPDTLFLKIDTFSTFVNCFLLRLFRTLVLYRPQSSIQKKIHFDGKSLFKRRLRKILIIF